MAGGSPYIRLSNVRKHFVRRNGTPVRAIDDISLDIRKGEFLVLLGPSGCGKTSLLRCIAGLETPDSGSVTIGERTVFDSTGRINIAPEKRRIGMMFQSYALWPHMTAYENVQFPLRMRGVDRKEAADKIRDVLTMMHISDIAQQHPGQLSGGQQQRIALARALVCSDELILFDEPLSNVDAKVREHLRFELSLMQKKLGFTAIYVTHDQDEAMALADRIVVLGNGRIAQCGKPQDIYLHPASMRVAEFVGSANFLKGTLLSTAPVARVETALGQLTVSGDQVKSGQQDVVVMSRPERWSISATPQEANNGWRGRISAVAFMGTHNEYLVDVGGQQLRVRDQRSQSLDVGTEVWCSIRSADLQVLGNERIERVA